MGRQEDAIDNEVLARVQFKFFSTDRHLAYFLAGNECDEPIRKPNISFKIDTPRKSPLRYTIQHLQSRVRNNAEITEHPVASAPHQCSHP